ncbi:MAG: hypothetical protein ACOY30_02640 [Bacillota bacterium]
MKGFIDSHHKHKVGMDESRLEFTGTLAVDVIGYSTISVLMGILFCNVFGPVV